MCALSLSSMSLCGYMLGDIYCDNASKVSNIRGRLRKHLAKKLKCKVIKEDRDNEEVHTDATSM